MGDIDELEDLDDIVADFLVESHENLDQLDRDLVQLESDPSAPDVLARVFRTIHTIKGASGFLALHRLEELTHVGENLLSRLRDGALPLTAERTSALLELVDAVRALLASVEAEGHEGDADHRPLVERLERLGEYQAPEVPHLQATVPAQRPGGVLEDAVRATDGAERGRRSAADSTVRVDIELLDTLMRVVGELVLARNQILAAAQHVTDPALRLASQQLSAVTGELQDGVMRTRMQPLDVLWSKLPRLVRDVSYQCGRQVRLTMEGGDTELDRAILEAIRDPLTHLVRNAVDHGTETPADRTAAGKPVEGTLAVSAFPQGGRVVVEIRDDGAGIDTDALTSVAVELGLLTRDDVTRLGRRELLDLVFHPGLSTAASVSTVSGRGVGMDVVRMDVERIGGTVELESELGRGTTCRLTIPLTLAILPALTISCGSRTYTLPQASVTEVVLVKGERLAAEIEAVADAKVYRLRDTLLPLVSLAEILALPATAGSTADRSIVVLQADDRRFGLVVDRVLASEDVVVKPLSRWLKGVGLYGGATVLGDGQVSLILDVQALARRSHRPTTGQATTGTARRDEDAASDRHDEQLLLVDVGDGRRVAIPLAEVTRLERLRLDETAHVGDTEVVRYRGAVVPLVRLAPLLLGRPTSVHAVQRRLPVVICSRNRRTVALAIDSVVDVVGADPATQSEVTGPCLTGSVMLAGGVVGLLDVRRAVLAGDPRFYDDEERP